MLCGIEMEESIKLITDGLRSICMTTEERRELFCREDSAIDDLFDFIVLDYLNGAVANKMLRKETADSIRELFQSADRELKDLTWQDQDKYMESSSAKVKEWKKQAEELLSAVLADHNSAFNP